MGKLNKLLAFHQPGKTSKGGRNAGSIPYTFDDMKRVGWCLDNNIRVCVIPNWKTAKMWMVQITVKGAIRTDPVDYTDEQALIKMYEYYKYYYDKYNED
jgi:hypothetical protein